MFQDLDFVCVGVWGGVSVWEKKEVGRATSSSGRGQLFQAGPQVEWDRTSDRYHGTMN